MYRKFPQYRAASVTAREFAPGERVEVDYTGIRSSGSRSRPGRSTRPGCEQASRLRGSLHLSALVRRYRDPVTDQVALERLQPGLLARFPAQVAALGVPNGKVALTANSSGHYWPDKESLEMVRRHLDAERLAAQNILVTNDPGIEAMHKIAGQLRVETKMAAQSSTTAH